MGLFSSRKGTPPATPSPSSRAMPNDEEQFVAVSAVPPAIVVVPPMQAPPQAPAPAPADSPVAKADTSAEDATAAASGAGEELRQHWLVLVLSCLAYVLLQASNAFVPAITMQGTSEELDMPISAIGALNSAGAGIKSILIIFVMGPVLDLVGT